MRTAQTAICVAVEIAFLKQRAVVGSAPGSSQSLSWKAIIGLHNRESVERGREHDRDVRIHT